MTERTEDTAMAERLITVVTPCYNEVDNVAPLYEAVRDVFAALPQYPYEIIFIDNASTDGTVEVLRRLADGDPHVRVIVNARNFGQVRSPYHAILQARGDAVIGLASDLQDPPELIPRFLEEWEKGSKLVLGVKTKSDENPLMFGVRRFYYRLIDRLSDVRQVQNATGFGLYDRQIVDILRQLNDPYPYFRGLVAEIGFPPALIEYSQPKRRAGITKNRFYSLYDLAMLGITSHSKVPLRLATMLGFGASAVSLATAFGYLVYKLLNWTSFSVGVAPLVIGLFFVSSVQLFFMGILGEYIGAIHTQVLHRPLVVERERINF
jgi:glycosyltransferase involved in cell wall biosynthesis